MRKRSVATPEDQPERRRLIQRLLRHRYGSRSEKLDLDQLEHSDSTSTSSSLQAPCFSLDLLNDEIREHSVAREQLDIALSTTHRAAELSRHLLPVSGADAAGPKPEIKA